MRARLLALVAAASLGACSPGAPPTATLSHHAPTPPTGAGTDTDDDGVPDARDGCPTVPEDLDLHQDQDGCPELDDDRDGVPDATDRCFDLPGLPPDGCPDGCSFMLTIDECMIITPIWSPTSTPDQLAAVKRVFDEYPEIRTVTLSTSAHPGDAPALGAHRLAEARRALVAAGVPEAKLAIDARVPEGADASSPPDVFGLITKQWLAAGPFRSTSCAGGMGTVFRPARVRAYDCRPRICGDGECWHSTEDDGSCPQDCPP
ncbi:MAG: hypothetical protein IPQ07_20225 [Myxococcales bacterium]|nr:hypothetical protein [Myxococcales bacterium]